jgi:hypothetical protein
MFNAFVKGFFFLLGKEIILSGGYVFLILYRDGRENERPIKKIKNIFKHKVRSGPFVILISYGNVFVTSQP